MSSERDREDVAATAESIVHDARQLVAIEEAKQAMDPSDPSVHELAADAERLANEIHQNTRAERSILKAAHDRRRTN